MAVAVEAPHAATPSSRVCPGSEFLTVAGPLPDRPHADGPAVSTYHVLTTETENPMPDGMPRRKREAQTVAQMIGLYCRAHHEGMPLCEPCSELLRYANGRIEACAYGDKKPTCRRCPIHCYDARHRERIRAVMRYAGPRMLLWHPLAALRHALR